MTSELMAVWVTAGATIGLLFATIVLARLTAQLASGTSSPQILVQLRPARWSVIHVEYVLENIGTGAAFDVQVSMDPPLQAFIGEGKPSKGVPFNNVSVVLPKAKLVSFIGESKNYLDTEHKITTSWARRPGGKNRQSLTYDLSLLHLKAMHTLGSDGGDPAITVANEFKKTRVALEKIGAFNRPLHVDIHTKDKRRAENEEFRARIKARQADDDDKSN